MGAHTHTHTHILVNGVIRALTVYTANRAPCLRRYISATNKAIVKILSDI